MVGEKRPIDSDCISESVGGRTDPVLELDAGGGGDGVGRSVGHALHVSVEPARRYLRVAGGDRLEHGVVDEHVLVLGLHHVVALGAQARHVTVDVDRAHVLETLEHRVDHDERARPTDARADRHTRPRSFVNRL